MTTHLDDNSMPLVAPSAAQSVGAVTDASATAMTETVIAQVQSGDFDLDEARDALTEKEFNAYVESLDGGADLNTDTLQAIARKLTKNIYKDSAKTRADAQVMAKSLKRLEAEIDRLTKEREDEKSKASKTAQDTSNDAVYSKLSEQCDKVGVNLESALGNAKVMETLRNESRNEDSPFTFLQEITAYNAKGKFSEAAKLVGEAVKRAGGEIKPVVVSPSESVASAVKHVEASYETELGRVHHAFNHSAKNFDDLQARSRDLEALRKKYQR